MNTPKNIDLNIQANNKRSGGGSYKDFFAGENHKFQEHLKNLQSQLNHIKRSMSSFTKISYAKVTLNP